MVGKAVTKKRPLSEVDVVTSILATLTPRSTEVTANRSQVGAKFLQAGHHGAKLEVILKFMHFSYDLLPSYLQLDHPFPF